jgi:hypothetical protein
LQYFPASIIEKTDPTGNSHSELRIFDEVKENADPEIPDRAFIKQLRNIGRDDPHKGEKHHIGPKLMFCITMYQEEWYQILQSVAGCIRAILELEDLDPDTYSHEKFAIVLICGKLILIYSFYSKSTR